MLVYFKPTLLENSIVLKLNDGNNFAFAYKLYSCRAFNSLCKLPNMAIQLCELSRNYQMDSFLNIFVSHLIKVVLRSMVVEAEDDESEVQSSLLLDILRDVDVDQTLKMHFTR